MKKRPIGVIVVAALFLLAGAGGLIGDGQHVRTLSANDYETVWIALVHVLAIVAAVFLFRAENWARWLAIAWMAFHVAISFLNSWQQAVMHGVIFVLIVWILFQREARAFFCAPRHAG
jgi:hypothetical protein